jgi:hypothetical protein
MPTAPHLHITKSKKPSELKMVLSRKPQTQHIGDWSPASSELFIWKKATRQIIVRKDGILFRFKKMRGKK